MNVSKLGFREIIKLIKSTNNERDQGLSLLVIDKFTDESFKSLKSDESIYFRTNSVDKQILQNKLNNSINNLNSVQVQEVSININFKKNETDPDFEILTRV